MRLRQGRGRREARQRSRSASARSRLPAKGRADRVAGLRDIGLYLAAGQIGVRPASRTQGQRCRARNEVILAQAGPVSDVSGTVQAGLRICPGKAPPILMSQVCGRLALTRRGRLRPGCRRIDHHGEGGGR
jgi:hypothetical protein